MKYVCLLRGINVGGKNKVSMSELKGFFEDLGFEKVATYINSGNIVFEATTIPVVDAIQKKLRDTLGYDITVVLLSANEMVRVADAIPEGWQNDTLQKTDVLFPVPEADDVNMVMKIGYNPDIETALYVPRAVIWNVERKYQTRSSLHKIIATKLYQQVTIRNVNTVRKLSELVK